MNGYIKKKSKEGGVLPVYCLCKKPDVRLKDKEVEEEEEEEKEWERDPVCNKQQ